MSEIAQPRSAKVIVAEALAELRAREQRLLALLTESRAAIGALAALGQPEQTSPPRRVEQIPPAETDGAPVRVLHRSPDTPPVSTAARDELVLRIIGEEQPCASGSLARRSGLAPGVLKRVMQDLRSDGKVQMVGQKAGARYWLTADLDRYVADHDGRLPDGSAA